jgi:hypothetical protein
LIGVFKIKPAIGCREFRKVIRRQREVIDGLRSRFAFIENAESNGPVIVVAGLFVFPFSI